MYTENHASSAWFSVYNNSLFLEYPTAPPYLFFSLPANCPLSLFPSPLHVALFSFPSTPSLLPPAAAPFFFPPLNACAPPFFSSPFPRTPPFFLLSLEGRGGTRPRRVRVRAKESPKIGAPLWKWLASGGYFPHLFIVIARLGKAEAIQYNYLSLCI